MKSFPKFSPDILFPRRPQIRFPRSSEGVAPRIRWLSARMFRKKPSNLLGATSPQGFVGNAVRQDHEDWLLCNFPMHASHRQFEADCRPSPSSLKMRQAWNLSGSKTRFGNIPKLEGKALDSAPPGFMPAPCVWLCVRLCLLLLGGA